MKSALIVGLDKYATPGWDLHGCANDTILMEALCRQRGFTQIITLKNEAATKGRILSYLRFLVERAYAGDYVLYYHSGHGCQVPDVNGDEADLLDECLVPYDHDWDAPYTDDELAKTLAGFHKEAYLGLIFDTCFSGGMVDSTKAVSRRIAWTPGLMRRRRFGVKAAAGQRHVLLSGCQEAQSSYETQSGRKTYGLMTWALYRIARQKKYRKSTWKRIRKEVARRVKRDSFNQTPALVGPDELIMRGFLR